MKIIADLHVHTISSGHAYSTVMENAQAAASKGLELIAITDHGPEMPGGTHPYHFSNMRVLPRNIFGVEILKGVEANILDDQGKLDLPDRFMKNLDIVLAGFHFDCIKPGSVQHNTRCMIAAITSGKVDGIVHPGNPSFKVDPEPVVLAAKEHNVFLEINNTSLAGVVRKGSKENCMVLAKLVAKHGGKVSLGSDAHYASQVGELSGSVKLAQDAGIKAHQVLNTSVASVKEFLKLRGRKREIPTPQV